MCTEATLKGRENNLINRMFARYKVALKVKGKNGGDDMSTRMVAEEENYMEPTFIMTDKEKENEKEGLDTVPIEYMCFVKGCHHRYGRKHQFKVHMLNTHGLCIVQNEFCQFCSDILDQFYHFGRKLKGGYKRNAGSMSNNKNVMQGAVKKRKIQKTGSSDDEELPSVQSPLQTDEFEHLVEEFIKSRGKNQHPSEIIPENCPILSEEKEKMSTKEAEEEKQPKRKKMQKRQSQKKIAKISPAQ